MRSRNVVHTAIALTAFVVLPRLARAQDEAPPAGDATADASGDEDYGEGPDPSRPPPKGKGVVWGVLTDTKLGEPLIEAQVTVVGTKYKTITDLDGRYRLELPPGSYNLRFFYELHRPGRLDGVQVTAGNVSKADFQLVPDEKAEDVVEVEAEVDRTGVEGQNLARKQAAAVGDAVGRAEIAKTPDKTAAEAAKRVVGATIVDNRFVYVRGLGERYTNSLLNGAPLPSPEPDRQTVPLDLFPALVLDNITIAKTFTPDMPGDFAGGSVRIQTRELPRETLLQASASMGYNTKSTFRDRLSYRGGRMDWLGIDDGTRALPGGLPSYKLSKGVVKPNGDFVLDPELHTWGQKFNSYMSTQRAFTPPNFGASVVVGDSFRTGKRSALGTMLAVSYGRSFQIIDDERLGKFAFNPNGGIKNLLPLRSERGIDSVKWGAFGSVSYKFDENNQLSLVGLHSRASDDTARELEGRDENRGADIHVTRLQFASRALYFGQLRGEHTFVDLDKAQLDWNLALSRATRDEPDTRDVAYTKDSSLGGWTYRDGAESGSHFFAKQHENTVGGGLDFTQPLDKSTNPTKLKLGGLVNLRSREFEARRYAFRTTSGTDQNTYFCSGLEYDTSCPDRLFTPGNVDSGAILLDESTRGTDKFTSNLNVYAGYLMTDAKITRDLRAIVGERLEVTRQSIDTHTVDGLTEVSPRLRSTDMLPSASLVFAATKDSNLRIGVSRTVARPQLKEIAPVRTSPYYGALPEEGNPDLKMSKIANGDLRFEYFPTLREVMAMSFFVKDFDKPIERVVKSSGSGDGVITYQNADGATLIGLELEARKNLEFLTKALSDFDVIANFTAARSRVQLDKNDQVGFVTNTSRPLANQSPWVINVALDYENHDSSTSGRILYNVFGPRISAVGTQGLPDVYEQPRHQLDFSAGQGIGKHFEVKFTATNLLNAPYNFTQGKDARDDNIVQKYTIGSTFSLGASYTY
ncbi:MAG: TonB-dependent receptor [Myxococcales bacterium]|nr:TonB-dependent receptor [Myxococcales bacterium]MCB9581872.1 TonB-dependent receptor [Polyangiaceae bacterium]